MAFTVPLFDEFMRRAIPKLMASQKVPAAVIARSEATRQSRFIKQIRTEKLPRFARNDGFFGFLRVHQSSSLD